ncbi:MAG: deoxyribonuclease IV [Phycisphaerales bacterium]|nr:deoxyribonuclease IV [Phycisphaerales bacterium]
MVHALTEAVGLGMDTVQVFTKNQQQWHTKPLDEGMTREWLSELSRLGWTERVVSHAGYLSNLATPDDMLWKKSIDLMTIEIERCEALSIPLLVHHPGAFTTSSREEGIERIAVAYKELLARTKGMRTILCLEGTVGAGFQLGGTFEELAAIRGRSIELTAAPNRIGYCLDTCHMHAAGYDMRTRASANAALDRFDQTCGLANLKAFHINDSKGPCGSHLDRHDHIGKGTIGGSLPDPTPEALRNCGFAAVVNHPRLRDVPKLLETPKGDDPEGRPWDSINLYMLRSLVDGTPKLPTPQPTASPARTRPRNETKAKKPPTTATLKKATKPSNPIKKPVSPKTSAQKKPAAGSKRTIARLAPNAKNQTKSEKSGSRKPLETADPRKP